MQNVPIHRSILFKLFALISLILIAALSANSWQNASSFYGQLFFRIQEKTMQNARMTANSVDTVVESWVSQIIVITNGISGMPKAKYNDMIGTLISSNKEFMTFELASAEDDGKLTTLATARSPYVEDERYGGKQAVDTQIKVRNLARKWMKTVAPRGNEIQVVVTNLTPDAGVPVLAIALPFNVKDSKERLWAVLTVWQTKLYAALGKGTMENAVVVDIDGGLISASDPKRLPIRSFDREHPVLLEVRKNTVPFGFKDWDNADGEKMLGAFARIPKYDLIAITESDGKPAYDAVRLIVVKTLLWAALLLLVATLLTWIASRGLTQNIRAVVNATVRIASGDFKSRAKISGNDEVSLLGRAVNHMGAQIESLLHERVEKARLETELATAKMVQEQFFPKLVVEDEFFRVKSYFQPASECGGDWWGHYRIGERLHLLVIADATGHGVPAALVTAMVFAGTSTVARQIAAAGSPEGSMSFLLTELNHTLCASGSTKHTMTCFACLIDMDTGRITYANGGHNFPLIVRRDLETQRDERRKKKGKRREMLQMLNNPLGIDPTSVYQEKTAQLDPGDKLFLYTDGLYECTDKNDVQWGKGKFLRLIEANADQPHEEFMIGIVKAAYNHFNGHPPNDDITVVVAEFSGEWAAKETVDDLDLLKEEAG